MGKNEFLPFGTAHDADVMSPDDYLNFPMREPGFGTGVAESTQLNTVWRQASVIAATFAQYIADRTGKDVLDDGDMAALLMLTKEALNAVQSVTAGDNTHNPDEHGDIKLGSAADADIVTSMTDTTAGRVTVVGWMGAGGNSDIAMGSVSQYLAYSSADKKEVPANGVGFQAAYAKNRRGQLFVTSDSGLHVRFTESDVVLDTDTQWVRVYTTLYKPSPADINAVNKTGDTMTGKLIINFDGEAITLQPKTAGYASYLISHDSSGANQWYVGKGSVNNDDAVFNNYKGGNNNINLKADGSVSIATANGKNVSITGQAIPSNYTNFDERYLKLAGGNVTGTISQDGVPQATYNETALTTGTAGAKNYLRKFRGGNADTIWHETVQGGAYRLATGNTDVQEEFSLSTSGIASFRGQVIPGNYTNFDNRYNAKYPAQFRVGARVTYNGSDFSSHVPQGAVNINNMTNNDDRINGVQYAYLQYNLNGNWVNFA